MGSSPKDDAVDGRGESWEAEGLYACDGSLLPRLVTSMLLLSHP